MAKTPLSKRWAALWSPIALPCVFYLVAVWLLVSAVAVLGFGLAILAGFLRDYGWDLPITATVYWVLYHPLVQEAATIGLLISFFAVGAVALFLVSVRILEVLESVARRVRKLS